MKRLFTLSICCLMAAHYSFGQVTNSYEYNTAMPYGTLDIRTRISSSDYYYLQENKTFSFRESSPGIPTGTYLDMTGWDSSPYQEGNLRHKKGTIDQFIMNYRLLFPGGYSDTYPDGYPLMVHFHGAVERANCYYTNCYHATPEYTVEENSPAAPKTATHRLLNNDHNLNVGGKQFLDARNLAGTRKPDDPSMPSRAFPGFVLSAQMFNIWDSLQVQDVIRIVRLVAEKYNIDQDRIYIQGISIGGYAVYESMKRASWLFAAALPMSSVWDANIFTQNQAHKVAHIPLWVFQGQNDPRPSPAYTESILSRFREAGGVARYTLYDNLSHVVWYSAYGTSDYYSWMLKQSKTNLHAFAGSTVIDKSTNSYPRLFLAEGYLAYQWEKDGVILGNGTHTLTVTTPGRYRARFSRKSVSPTEAQWNKWSPYVTITQTGTSEGIVQVSITSPDDGQTFNAPASVSIMATASDSDGTISKVEFYNGATKLGEDSSSPYTFTWSSVPQGTYWLKARAIDDSGNSATDTVSITVNPAPTGTSCLSTGNIQAEMWTGISGLDIGSIPVNASPSSVSTLSLFETPRNVGDNYGTRVRGYVCVPYTGDYTFWIASDDRSELWLSTDENPANKRKIASVSGWTNPRQWDKYTSQQSGALLLEAGRKYYVEALLKEATGGDHLAVGWQLPGGALERPIAGNRLITFESSANSIPTVNITSPDDAQVFTAPASVNITATASDSDGSVTKVEFYNDLTKLGEDATAPYSFTWSGVPAGSYSLRAKAIDNTGDFATDMIEITVNGGSTGEPCASTGGIQVETWNGISGFDIGSIPVNSTPSSVSDLTLFETPQNVGDNYGSRVRGYICVPVTGSYTFWIASDDKSELWLSTDDNPANKTRIAYISAWTYSRQWDKYSTQRSEAISLAGGRRYYIEALLKEAGGGDHLAVGWQLPGGALERPIPGGRLIPFNASPPVSEPTPTGEIEVERWTGISGTSVSSVPVDAPPNSVSPITIFETAKDIGDNYASRVRGYVHAPATGSYTFWIASDDNGELWLSTDENPDNKVRIAYVSGWTYSRQWDKYTQQRSALVNLVAGGKYYIEALLKEAAGGDHLAVGWQLPGGTLERPIPGNRLSKFETAGAAMATQDATLYSQISVYPNPVESGEAALSVGGYERIARTIHTQVEIINLMGEVVFKENISCGGDCSTYLLAMNKQLVPGAYLVNLRTNGVGYSKRLLVK